MTGVDAGGALPDASAEPSAPADTTPGAEEPADAAAGDGTGDGSGAGAGGDGDGDGDGDGRLVAGGSAVLPLSSASATLTQYADKNAKARGVRVQSVPADEGFWVGSSKADRVWIQLTGKGGESPFQVKAGDRIDFDGGKVVSTANGFPAQVGVSAAEGAAQLEAQQQHIEVARKALSLSS